MKKVILTGDRPTGPLHIGHYVGSLKNRVRMQNEGNYDEMYVFIADAQALTDNFDNPQKVKDNILEVALDYLAVGLDPDKVTIFIQSEIPELTELTFYYMNLVTVSRLYRNPTVKSEIEQKGIEESIPAGFLTYPVSQAADITAFKTNVVPVGDDQLPMIEQTREIVRKFNRIYDEVLVEPEAKIPESKNESRLIGTDGNAKMSKSLGNCIYLKDSEEEVRKKIMSMYTDPNHINIGDPGKVEGNMVFTYLDAFVKDDDFLEYAPEYKNLDEMKEHYRRGGLGDVKIKKFLINVLNREFAPIRERRAYFENHIEEVIEILKNGTEKAKNDADKVLTRVKRSMGINYFDDDTFIDIYKNKYNKE